MLLRDTNPSDFRVPSVPRRAVAADDAKAKAERVGEEALRRRDERDANLAAAHERARARSSLFKMFAEEGRPADGFVRGADEALNRYKASPEALRGDDLKSLERDVRGHAMRLEAAARARERVLQAGRTLDTLIAATRTAPQNFAAHAEAARELVARLRLPEKATAAFRARLPEIPEAALAALIERDPQHAGRLIETREGPASAEHGLDRATLRVLAKHANAAIDEAEQHRTATTTTAAMRAHADAANAIDAAERGEGNESALTAWLTQSEKLGPAATRMLRRQSRAAAKTVARRKAATASARKKLARGEPLDDTDREGLDAVYAALAPDDEAAFVEAAGALPAAVVRRIAADLKSGDPTRAQRAAEFVVALEAKNKDLLDRLPKTLRAEAHRLADATTAGFTATDAAAYLSVAADIPNADRTRRTTDFDRTIDGATLARAIEQAFAVGVAGIADT